jgi:uncharacterized membrane protein YfcA
MDPLTTIFLCCLLLGALVGVLAGLLGIGGGLIMVPILLYLFKHTLLLDQSIAMPMAVATSLFTIILTGLSASLSHYKLANLSPFIILFSGLGIALGATMGAQLASHITADWLQTLFAILVIIIAIYMLFGKRLRSEQPVSKGRLVGVGLGTGLLSAFMGIGGGVVMVPALVWFRVEIKKAIGCASFCGVLVAIFGSISFMQAGWGHHQLPDFSMGYVYMPAALGIVCMSVFTARFGANLSQSINTQRLKVSFVGLLIIAGGLMLIT